MNTKQAKKKKKKKKIEVRIWWSTHLSDQIHKHRFDVCARVSRRFQEHRINRIGEAPAPASGYASIDLYDSVRGWNSEVG